MQEDCRYEMSTTQWLESRAADFYDNVTIKNDGMLFNIIDIILL